MSIIKYIFMKSFRDEKAKQFSRKIAESLGQDYEDLELIYSKLFERTGKVA